MNKKELVFDALRYPLSDWKKILILGIIIVISSLYIVAKLLGITNNIFLDLLGISGLLIGVLLNGYAFRIIKSTLTGAEKLPEFNILTDMFINGIRALFVAIVYATPCLIVLIFAPILFALLLGTLFPIAPDDNGFYPGLLILFGIFMLFMILFTFIYLIVIFPIYAIALANMAHSNNKLTAAFRFHEILNKIRNIGWINGIMQYILLGIPFVILFIISGFIITIFRLIHPVIGIVIILLIVVPYLEMYMARSIALVYTLK